MEKESPSASRTRRGNSGAPAGGSSAAEPPSSNSTTALSASNEGFSTGQTISIQLSPQEAATLVRLAAQSAIIHQGASRQPYENLANALQSVQPGYPTTGSAYNSHPHQYTSQAPRTLPFPDPQWSQQRSHDLPTFLYNEPPESTGFHPGHPAFLPTPSAYQPPPLSPISAGQGPTSPTSPRSRSSSTVDGELTEADLLAIAEDKRQRNTAASARFRIKKKQRTINLERSVSDLAGRADELEKEAAELRRENGWLKEIVMLKGSRLTSGAQNTAGSAGGSNVVLQSESESDEDLADEGKSPGGKGN